MNKYQVSLEHYTLLRHRYAGIRSRCNDKNDEYYYGLPNTLSLDELFTIWNRDKGWLLTKPSIDRIDSKDGYTFENCRFIELSLNLGLGSKNRDAKKISQKLIGIHGTLVKQLTLNGQLVNIFCSVNEAGRRLNIHPSNIIKVCKNERTKAGGFKWQYA